MPKAIGPYRPELDSDNKERILAAAAKHNINPTWLVNAILRSVRIVRISVTSELRSGKIDTDDKIIIIQPEQTEYRL